MGLNVQSNTMLFVFICLNVYARVMYVCFILRSFKDNPCTPCVVFCMRCVILSGWQVPKTHFKNRILNQFMLCSYACISTHIRLYLYVVFVCGVFVTRYMPMREHESYTKETDLTTIEMSFEKVCV